MRKSLDVIAIIEVNFKIFKILYQCVSYVVEYRIIKVYLPLCIMYRMYGFLFTKQNILIHTVVM
jgi:hypothetical protein